MDLARLVIEQWDYAVVKSNVRAFCTVCMYKEGDTPCERPKILAALASMSIF